MTISRQKIFAFVLIAVVFGSQTTTAAAATERPDGFLGTGSFSLDLGIILGLVIFLILIDLVLSVSVHYVHRMRARQKESPSVPNNANPPQELARLPKAATSGPTYSPYKRITPTPQQQQQLLLLPTTQLPVQLQQQVSTPQPQTPNPPTPPSKPIQNQMVNDYKPIRLNPIALSQQPYNALLQQPLPQNQPQSYPSVQSLSTPYQQTLPVQSSSSIFNKPFQFNVPIGIPRLPRLPFRAPRMGDLFNRIIPNPRSVTGYFQDIRSYLPRLNIPLKIPSPSSSPSSSRSLLPKLQFARGDPQQNGPFLPRIVIPSSTA